MALTHRLRLSLALAALSLVAVAPVLAFEDEEPMNPVPGAPPRGLPSPWIPRENPWTQDKADLGERLFNEEALSKDRTVSCATCHPAENAYTDGEPLAIGIRKQRQKRNAPTLLNVAYSKHPFWDGRSKSLEDQAGDPIVNPTEMDLTEEEAVRRIAGDATYAPLFTKAFGDKTVTFERLRFAIASFERTLLAGDSPFDRWWAGNEVGMSEKARDGFKVFMGPGRCSSCHPARQSFSLFTDDQFHNTGAGEGDGLKDAGRMDVTGKASDRGKFKTPTLRNVALTGPYMHDGSLKTLLDVVDFYDKGGVANDNLSEEMRPLFLSDKDKTDLVAFLEALTSREIPGTKSGRELLKAGEYARARDRFLLDLKADAEDLDALWGLAEASLGTGEREHLDNAAERLADAAVKHEDDKRAWSLIWQGRVYGRLSQQADAVADFNRATAHREDAAFSFDKAREAASYLDDAYLEGAAAHETAGRGEKADEVLTALIEKNESKDADAAGARAGVRYRLALAAARANSNRVDERAKRWFEGAVADDRAAVQLRQTLQFDYPSHLRIARCLHWLGRRDEARDAYVHAIRREPDSRDALTGLASLLSVDPDQWTAALERIVEQVPDHRQALYFLGYDRFVRLDLEGARDSFTTLAERSPQDAMAQVFLGRIARDTEDVPAAFDHFEQALRIDAANPHAINDWDALLRDLPLGGWEDFRALDAQTHRLIDACGVQRARILARNNLAFRMRDAVSSWTSRGRGRMQYLVKGAPPEVMAGIRRCAAIYEAAVAELPADDVMMGLSFEERWVYAGVLNDAGLIYHYLAPVQDLEKAEHHYLRAFRITEGAYMDAYFYNLQFLYGFEMEGRERRWYRLASAARDAILKETADGGFEPDLRKRSAAQRDYERLRDQLGEEVADEIELEELP